ncbi:MAG: hypothetical protein OEY34_10580 [Cyclobacteriaceae bacterium]|nr:hypothetical protein [Cyclobacteriaceae bacterium]
MKRGYANYIIGLGFLVLAFIMYIKENMLELGALLCASFAFIITGYSLEDGINPSLKKTLSILSWVLIIITAIYFYYLLRTDFFR